VYRIIAENVPDFLSLIPARRFERKGLTSDRTARAKTAALFLSPATPVGRGAGTSECKSQTAIA
jgi:hypothetical protein